jgi:hypothetical protein
MTYFNSDIVQVFLVLNSKLLFLCTHFSTFYKQRCCLLMVVSDEVLFVSDEVLFVSDEVLFVSDEVLYCQQRRRCFFFKKGSV